ncbi:putative Transcription factor domain-containing protein [Seiridium cardinale]|uniref:Transcription factor domain-containing protein n=1 Tax=Seiridium cardinale TaxID=138064 RepID=A0ABR2Y280_9PEZI
MCALQPDLVLAPLPAKKKLWEANDEFAWKTESERQPASQTEFGLASDGELVKVNKGQIYCDHTVMEQSVDTELPLRSTANWGQWYSGMDSFGGLVMLAAALIG